MSETVEALIKAAYRSIGVIATGETPTDNEMQDGLEALQLMLRHWSADNIRVYYTVEDSKLLTGASSYTIGSGGAINTARPEGIKRVWVESGNDDEIPVHYRYNAGYPLGTIYVDEDVTGTLYIESWKLLTEPTLITSTVSFPPEYDEAIKYNLAVRLAPEYGKEISQTVAALALSALKTLETKNFSNQIESVMPEILSLATRWDIKNG